MSVGYDMKFCKKSRKETMTPKHFEFRFMSVAGWEKLLPHEDFVFSSVGAVEGGWILTGSLTRTLTKGPNKGKLVWYGKKAKVLVTLADVMAAELRYERDTGKCCKCLGPGQRAYAYTYETGVLYRECKRCEGTGRITPA